NPPPHAAADARGWAGGAGSRRERDQSTRTRRARVRTRAFLGLPQATARRRAGAAIAPLLVGVVLLSGCVGDVVSVTFTEELEQAPAAQTSVMLAADGTVLAELHGAEDREPVALEDVPQVVRDAVVAIEDERFYTHSGVDLRAIARALVS